MLSSFVSITLLSLKAKGTKFNPIHYLETLQCLKLNSYILAVERRMLPKFYKGLHLHILLPYSVPFAKH